MGGYFQGTPQGLIVLINAHIILLRRKSICCKGSDRDDSENVAISIDANISHVGGFSNV